MVCVVYYVCYWINIMEVKSDDIFSEIALSSFIRKNLLFLQKQ